MPTSEFNTIPSIINEVISLQPKSILDLGTGCGKYAVLCREYLDGAHGRISYDEWTVKIVAVDGFPRYLGPLHQAVCDYVAVQDFSEPENYKWYKDYDLVLMIDSLEHLPRERGERLLNYLLENNKRVIVSVPWGVNFLPQGAVFGNELERHLGEWRPNDFAKLKGKMLYLGVCTAWSLPGRG